MHNNRLFKKSDNMANNGEQSEVMQSEVGASTIEQLAELIKKGNSSLSTQIQSINDKFDMLTNRVDNVEREVKKVSTIQDKHIKDIRELQHQQKNQTQINERVEEAITILEQKYKSLHENQDRQRRAANIIVHGVSEQLNALDILKDIMNLIYNASDVRGRPMRIGIANANKVRPFRVRLSNSDHVQSVLVKSNTLKDYEKYRGVYVTRDETREQQILSRQKRAEYAQKRKEMESDSDMSTIKRKRYDDDMPVHHTQMNPHIGKIGQTATNAVTVEQVEQQMLSQAQVPVSMQTNQNENTMATPQPPHHTHAKNYFISGNPATTPISSRNGQQ